MRIAQATTAVAQYHAMRDSGELAPKQRMILSAMLAGHKYSRRELSRLTGLETSCIAGRVKELLDMNLLEVVGVMRCPLSGKQVEALKLPTAQAELFS